MNPQLLNWLKCRLGGHEWTTVECPAHKPSHTIERFCLRCHAHDYGEGCGTAPEPTRGEYERARRECDELSEGTNGNVPIQSVYEVLVRCQMEARLDATRIRPFTQTSATNATANWTVTWR